MSPLPEMIIAVLVPFAGLFSSSVWGHARCYRDAVRSTANHVVKCFGLKWLSLMVVVRLPCRYQPLHLTLPGHDLYSRQPLCQAVPSELWVPSLSR